MYNSSYAKKSSVASGDDPWDEPAIVLDDLGEKVVKKKSSGSFLGDY